MAGDVLRTLANPAAAALDQFGASVAVDGELVVVGAPFDDPGGVTDAGSVYVFSRTTGNLMATIPNPEPAAGDQFGYSVVVSDGGYIWVGAPFDDPAGVTDSGTVYGFFNLGGFVGDRFNNPSPAVGDQFGFSLSRDPNSSPSYLGIGAPGDDFGATDAGQAYVAAYSGGNFFYGTASNPTPGAGDGFGGSVSVGPSGNLLIGAPFDDPGNVTDTGAAFVYNFNAGTITSTLTNPDPTAGDRFGYSVSFAGNTALAVVGAPLDDFAGVTDSGTAYVFDAFAGSLVTTLGNPNPSTGDNFGAFLAASSVRAVVSAPLDDPAGVTDAGTAYEFDVRTGGAIVVLSNPSPTASDRLGPVAVYQNQAVVAVPLDDPAGVADAGSVSVYDLNVAPTAAPDTAFASKNTTTLLGVLVNDSTGGDFQDSLTVTAVTNSANGGVVDAYDGTAVRYTTPFNFIGTDTFTYTVRDANGLTATTTVTVRVGNPPPLLPYGLGLAPGGTTAFQKYGTTVAASGNVMAIATDGSTSVSVFDVPSGSLIRTLTPPTAAGNLADMGHTVAIAGNLVAVGLYRQTAGGRSAAGAVYVYDITTGALVRTLTAPTPVSGGWFGYSVAITGTTVVVGAYEDNVIDGTGLQGTGRVFAFDVTTGSVLQTFTDPSPPNRDQAFGAAVAVDGNTLVVGAPTTNAGANLVLGQAYVYNLSTGALLKKLNTPGLGIFPLFGTSVAISGSRIVVGSYDRAYLFNTSTGAFVATLSDPVVAPGPTTIFPVSVAIADGRVLLGTIGDDTTGLTQAGGAYLFNAADGTYLRSFLDPVLAANDRLGYSVALATNTALIGEPNDDSFGATDAGLVLLFDTRFPPTPKDDTVTVAEDSGATIVNVLGNDVDSAGLTGTLTVTDVTQPASGGAVTLAGGVVRFTPTANFSGPTSFTYTVTDAIGTTATATVAVTVTAVNDPPTAGADAVTVAEDSGATAIDVLANDTFAPDVGETLSVTAVSQPTSGGSVTLVGGVVRFTPAANFHGARTFTYTLSDGNGGTAVGTVTVTVTAVNDAPTANTTTVSVAEDSFVDVDLRTLAADVETPATQLTFVVANPAHGAVQLRPDGHTARFTPAADYNGPAAFTYSVTDTGDPAGTPGNALTTGPQSVTVTVTAVNDAPTANPGTAATAEDTFVDVDLRPLVADLETPLAQLTFAVSGPTHGTVQLRPDGHTARFTPAADYNGPAAFTYAVTDSGDPAGAPGNALTTNPTVVTVSVSAVNDVPAANATTVATAEDAFVDVDLRTLVSDRETPAAQLVFGVSGAANGTVQLLADGHTARFTPAADYNGPAAFTYAVTDTGDPAGTTGDAATTSNTVSVTVAAVNDPPAAGDDTVTIAEDSGATVVGVLANDSTAPDAGEALTVTNVTQPLTGGVVTLAGGIVRFIPTADFNGAATFTYTVSDGHGGTAVGAVTVTVTPVNDAPAARDASLNTTDGTAVQLDLRPLASDRETASGSLVFTVGGAVHGAAQVLADGHTARFVPDVGYTGPAAFTYSVTDAGDPAGNTANSLTTSNRVTVTVEPQIRALDDAVAVSGDGGAVVVDVLANDSLNPLSGGSLAVAAVTDPATGGAVSLQSGAVRFTPAAGFSGTTSFAYTVTNGVGGRATAVVTVTVTAAPPITPPTLVGESEFAAGADVGSGTATLYNADGTPRFTTTPFPGFTGGVRTAVGDFNRDGVADLVVGTGPGRATRVIVYDGVTQRQLFATDPFEPSFTGGVYVTAGDVNGDGVPDLAVTPDEGGGPRVDVYSGADFARLVSFFGIDDPNFRGGARASIGDLTGDGTGDLVVVAGFGGGPRVAGFDGTSLSGTPRKIFADFFAFEQSLRNGIFVTTGDLNGDGIADLIAGGGPGGGPRILALDGQRLTANQYLTLANFFGGDPTSRGGIRLAVKNLDNDTKADLVVGSGAGAGGRVTSYLGKTISFAGTPAEYFAFDADAAFTGGVFVG